VDKTVNGLLWCRLVPHKQKVKGAVVFLLEISFIYFMINTAGIARLHSCRVLGETDQTEVWNEAKRI
jgi:hypothetical protein